MGRSKPPFQNPAFPIFVNDYVPENDASAALNVSLGRIAFVARSKLGA
jgi:hypothetical protein